MSRYYGNYSQYLGAQKCCDLRTQGPVGPQGPPGPAGVGERGWTGPAGQSFTGPTGRGCRGPTGEQGPIGTSVSMIGGLATNLSNNSVNYFGGYAGSFTTNSTITESESITTIPFNCSISNFYISANSDQGETDRSYTFYIRKNGVNTSVTTSLVGLTTSNSDLINSVSFNSGDNLTISANPSQGTSGFDPVSISVRWSCRLTNP